MDGRPGAMPARSAVPSSVRTASLMLWVLVGLMVIRTALTIALLGDLVGAYDEGQRPGQTLPREGAPAYVPIALFSLLVFGGLLALCAVFVRRGAGWARIVATMFASLAALAGLLVLLQPSTALFTFLGLLNAAVAVTAVVLLFSRESNAFFLAVRGRSRGPQPSA